MLTAWAAPTAQVRHHCLVPTGEQSRAHGWFSVSSEGDSVYLVNDTLRSWTWALVEKKGREDGGDSTLEVRAYL